MALNRTSSDARTSAEGFGTAGFASNSFTPSDNSLLVVIAFFVAETDTGAEGDELTINDSAGLAWTPRIATNSSPGWTYGIASWTAPVTSGASMTVTIDAGTENVHVYRVLVFNYTGYDTVTPIGATARGADADGDGAASIIMSGAPAADSDVLAAVLKIVNSGVPGAITAGTGWTELSEVGVTDWGAFQAQARTGSTSTTVGWDDLDVGGSPAGAAMLALEIKAAAGSVLKRNNLALMGVGR